MERLIVRLRGTLTNDDGSERGWYAYWINHPIPKPTTAILYTTDWADERTPPKGKQILVWRGVVRIIARGSQIIPEDGFVLLLTGEEEYLARRFRIGARCRFFPLFESEEDFWTQAREALGCGPRLVTRGRMTLDPTSEGFGSPKILHYAAQRSAVGITRDGTVLWVTCPRAKMTDLARVMQTLGAYDAMNLDGGASSGLWLQGRYLRRPGRLLSNALLALRR
jgi:hypothetical protein